MQRETEKAQYFRFIYLLYLRKQKQKTMARATQTTERCSNSSVPLKNRIIRMKVYIKFLPNLLNFPLSYVQNHLLRGFEISRVLKNFSPWQNIVLPAALHLGVGQIDLQVLGVLTSLESGESWWGILTVFIEFVTEEKEGTDWRQIIPKLGWTATNLIMSYWP